MSDTDLAFLPATELRKKIVSKEVSPVEVTRLYLDRIEKFDGKLNAYLTVTDELAMEQARSAEAAVMKGDRLGPLHGIPTSIKDLESTEGIRFTGGSLMYQDRIGSFDTIVVERVKRAGAIILGKTNTPEFGLLGHTENRLGDHCRNPWNVERTTGGSSGGAAASIAAGMASLSTGSDGGGSIRIPCGFCGIYGIKPSQGRIPYYLGPGSDHVMNLFSQSGPMTRTVADTAMLLQVLAGPDSRDRAALREQPDDYIAATKLGVENLKIGWTPDFGYAEVDSEVVQVTEAAAKVFEDIGATVEELDLTLEEPFNDFWPIFTTIIAMRNAGLPKEQYNKLAYYTQEALDFGKQLSGIDFVKSLSRLDVMKSQFSDVFDRYDLILTPTLAVPAFPVGKPPLKIGEKDTHWFWGYTPFTMPINMIGSTAASVPCGFSSDGLPMGLHIIGRWGDESTVLAASAAFEQARPWIQHRPQLS